jgi:hypothetical protein
VLGGRGGPGGGRKGGVRGPGDARAHGKGVGEVDGHQEGPGSQVVHGEEVSECCLNEATRRNPEGEKEEEEEDGMKEEEGASGSGPQQNGDSDVAKEEEDGQHESRAVRAKSSRPGRRSRSGSSLKKQGTIVKSSSDSGSSQPSDDSEKLGGKSETWRVTVSSNQDLTVDSSSPNTIVVKNFPQKEDKGESEENVKPPTEVEQKDIEHVKSSSPPPPPPPIAKPKARVVQPKVSLPKDRKARAPKIAKKQSVVAAAATSSSSQEAPPPPTAKLPDARSDPIPKPTQYPSARPPRDYKPLRRSVAAANGSRAPAKREERREVEEEGSSSVIQMLVKEEAKEVGLADIPLSSQV